MVGEMYMFLFFGLKGFGGALKGVGEMYMFSFSDLRGWGDGALIIF